MLSDRDLENKHLHLSDNTEQLILRRNSDFVRGTTYVATKLESNKSKTPHQALLILSAPENVGRQI
jgi:hypothetical protein